MFDLNASILDPEYGDEVDEGRLCEYIDTLMTEFADSPEADQFQQEFDNRIGWTATYIEYAANYLGATLATMTPRDSNEVLLELFPRKVSVEPDAAGRIVGELRAFWQFLKRTRTVESADAILESLTEHDVEVLEGELSDESNFGMAKSFVMAGKRAGYDMTNQDDMNRFMLAYNASRLSALAAQPVREHRDVEASKPYQSAASTIRHTQRRVGRNDPCPCGSGRKYKKCCGG